MALHERTVRLAPRRSPKPPAASRITQEINSAVEEQASGAQAVVRRWIKCANSFSSPASSSTELSAAAETDAETFPQPARQQGRFVLAALRSRHTRTAGIRPGTVVAGNRIVSRNTKR